MASPKCSLPSCENEISGTAHVISLSPSESEVLFYRFGIDRYRLLTIISISDFYYILSTEKVVLKRTMRDFSCEQNYCWDIKITQQRWLGDLKWGLVKTTKSVKNSEKFLICFI